MFHSTTQKKLIAGLRDYEPFTLEELAKRIEVAKRERKFDFQDLLATYRVVTDSTYTLHTPKLSVLNTLRKSIKPGGEKRKMLLDKYDSLQRVTPAEVAWSNETFVDLVPGGLMIVLRTPRKKIIKLNATMAASIIEYSRVPVDSIYVTNSNSPIQLFAGKQRVGYVAPITAETGSKG